MPLIRADFLESYLNTEVDLPFRYSAALGMSEKTADDTTLEFVFRRADKAMYNDKLAFKDKYGSYR